MKSVMFTGCLILPKTLKELQKRPEIQNLKNRAPLRPRLWSRKSPRNRPRPQKRKRPITKRINEAKRWDPNFPTAVPAQKLISNSNEIISKFWYLGHFLNLLDSRCTFNLSYKLFVKKLDNIWQIIFKRRVHAIMQNF